jgi:Fic family protein
MIKYVTPQNWLNYDIRSLIQSLTEAKAAVLSLVNIPYQRSWVEALQAVQLKSEVAGTSKIEGADFTDRELNLALGETPEQLVTRSQKQAHAAMKAYKWIAALPKDRPVTCDLIREVHAMIIGDADSDHCEPGVVRKAGINVTFGLPPHRGCEGGKDCEGAFEKLGLALQREFQEHDQLIQALALHFHFAVMHPFLDGNGRTARAVEALMLQRSGLTDHLFIAMSNYYYDEKTNYLSALSAVKPPDYDLTPFLAFGLKGIKIQCQRLFEEIRANVTISIFKNTVYDLFGRLQSKRKTVIAGRHIALLNFMLKRGEMPLIEIFSLTDHLYAGLKAASKARLRDVIYLLNLDAVKITTKELGKKAGEKTNFISVNLDWPKQITENGFMEKSRKLPKAKSYPILFEAK